jgi:hypothetical protein
MASAAHLNGSSFYAFARPLSLRELGALAGVGVVAMLAYCIFHELIQGFQFAPLPALMWALAGVLPLVAAYELLKRAPDRVIRSRVPLVLTFLGTTTLVVGVSTVLNLLNGLAFFGVAADPVEIALRRVPIMALLTGAALFSIRVGREEAISSTTSAKIETFAEAAQTPSAPTAPPAKPSLHLPDGHFIPDVSLVSSIRAAANYVEIQVGDGIVLTRATMSDLEERLSAHGFRRIHRSVIVNWAMVESVGPQRKRLSIKLTTGERLAVGPSYRDHVISH